MPWRERLKGDPLPWLLEPDDPAVRTFALTELLDVPADDPEVMAARAAINRSRPVKAILEAQHPDGYWVMPGPGYAPKYKGTVWQVIFLDQIGADPADPRVRAGCEYVLAHTQTANGGFGCAGGFQVRALPNSAPIHCLHGNLLRAMLGFGYAGDERVQRAVEWQARSVTGDGFADYSKPRTSGPGFACGVNSGLPCAWGAVKGLRALARVQEAARTPQVKKAIRMGTKLLLSRDPAAADYPAGDGRVSPLWFKLGFPSGYVADVLQVLEVLAELGHGRDRRLRPALEWVLSKQDRQGRWKNQNNLRGKLWEAAEPKRAASKWVTLRALRVVKAAG
jgi:hypothetical protein